MPPPIRLLDYVVEQLSFDTNAAFRSDLDQIEALEQKTHLSVNLDVEWQLRDGEESREAGEGFLVSLAIHVNDTDDFAEHSFYRAVLRMTGLFERDRYDEIEGDVSKDEYARHSLASGISMLYGAARNVLSSLTSQAPYRKLLLPAIGPYAVAKRVLEHDDPADSSTR